MAEARSPWGRGCDVTCLDIFAMMDNLLGFLSLFFFFVFFFLILPGTAFNEFGKRFFCKNPAPPELFLKGLIEETKR